MFISKYSGDNLQTGIFLCSLAFIISAIGVLLFSFHVDGISPFSDRQGTINNFAIPATTMAFIILVGIFSFWLFPKESREESLGNISGAFMVYASIYVLGGMIFGIIPFIPFIIGTLIISEILFWVEKDRPGKKDDVKRFVVKRKLENLFEGGLFSGILIEAYYLQTFLPSIMGILALIAEAIAGFALISIATYAYLALNAKKYRKN